MTIMTWRAPALAALLLTQPAHAQAAPLAQPPADRDIVVLGAGLPLPPGTPAYGAVILDRERLTNSASGRIEGILSDVAGFQQFRRSDSRSANPSAQGATLRALGGNASSRTLVLLDGVPVADPFFGYIPFSALVPDRLSLIRVTRGGGIGAFGAGAVAGTIELASATRADLPAMSASGFHGSHGSNELSASLSPSYGDGFLSVAGRYEQGDGFQTTPASQRTVATVPGAYESWSSTLRAVLPMGDDVELQARGLLYRDERTLRFRGADSASEGQDVSLRLVSQGRWKVDALGYFQARNFTNVVISATSFRRSLDQRDTPSTGLGGKLEVRPPVGEAHVLRLGLDTRSADGELFEDAYNATTGALTARRNAGGRQNTTGLFAEDDWTLGKLVLTAGARADRWTITKGFFETRSPLGIAARTRFDDRDGHELSGRAGALLRLGAAVALRGAAYTGFRLPTLNELYRPFAVFPVTPQANAALMPEKLKGIEAGVELIPAEGIAIGGTLFYNRLGDAIANVTIGTNLRERRNVKAIVAKGIELTANGRAGRLSFNASYAYSHSSVDAPGQAFDGLVPSQSPRHAASATFGWTSETGVRLSGTVRYVSAQYEDDLQTDILPAAVTVDAVASLPLGQGIALTGRAENLFDKAVVTRNAAGSIDLGTPRILWIGVRFEG